MSEVSQPNELIETIEKALAQAAKGGYHVGVIADEWLRALLEENKRLETKYHVDMNNYRSQVQTWQQQHDSQIVALRTELSAKDKVLEWYASTGHQIAKDILSKYRGDTHE